MISATVGVFTLFTWKENSQNKDKFFSKYEELIDTVSIFQNHFFHDSQ